jgi:hypothetical protein
MTAVEKKFWSYDLSNADCSNSKEDMSSCPQKKRKVGPDHLGRKPGAKRTVALISPSLPSNKEFSNASSDESSSSG